MLIEDHRDYREVINIAIAKQDDMEMIHAYGYAERALRAMETLAKNEAPDIILLDLNLPGISGLDAIPWIKDYVPEAKIVILSQSDKKADVLRAIQLGASGYLLKSSRIEQITECIHTIASGGAILDTRIAHFILDKIQASSPTEFLKKPLSERELEVLTIMAQGLVKKEISNQLKISQNTVAMHIKHIYEKLQVQNAPSAISKAYRSGILSIGKENN